MSFRLRNYAEQVADHLRSEIFSGRWVGELPGEDRLSAELGVNHTTVGAAIRQMATPIGGAHSLGLPTGDQPYPQVGGPSRTRQG